MEIQEDNEMDIDCNLIDQDELCEYLSDKDEEEKTEMMIRKDDHKKELTMDSVDLKNLYADLNVEENSKKKNSSFRLNVIHIRGVQEMNTEDILEYFNEYQPNRIEWVNDISCNIVFDNQVLAGLAIHNLTSSLVVHKSQSNKGNFHTNREIIDASSLDISIPPFRWLLGKKHEKAKILLLRFATTADKKIFGAFKYSQYYLKYGLPQNIKRLNRFKRRPKFQNKNILSKISDAREAINSNVGKMKADEEERKQHSQVSERLGSSFASRSNKVMRKKSVWERLNLNQSFSNSSSSSLTQTVYFKNTDSGVFSRLGSKRTTKKKLTRF